MWGNGLRGWLDGCGNRQRLRWHGCGGCGLRRGTATPGSILASSILGCAIAPCGSGAQGRNTSIGLGRNRCANRLISGILRS